MNLEGKKVLIVGIANENSIAWGCAKAMREAGAEIAVTYVNDKAKKWVEPLAQALEAPLFLPLDVTNQNQMDELFYEIRQEWGKLDIMLHCIAFAPLEDLHGRVVDVSQEGFSQAMDISCHSFMRMAQHAEPLMINGGRMMTVTYYGSEKVIDNYNIMGPVKAALESSVRYMAAELGSTKITVNAISPGPIMTRAGSGIKSFNELIEMAHKKAPGKTTVSIEDVGAMAAFLASDGARYVTGGTHYVDACLSAVG